MAIRFNDFFVGKTDFEGYMLDLFLNVSDNMVSKLREDKEYADANEKYINLLEQVESLLPEDKKRLVEELDKAQGTASSIFNQAIFIKGLQFGVGLARLLKITDVSKEV